ncbi:S8 family serine peptidase [Tabrizicola aquatica]|uniref:S8 family serine peptidase n=1 Tax=Tabrizicola aquatica TaxID=909926 RepID=UPI000CD244C7|nr:S8 family serine peptidase [Tabrizicola aquatica]
MTKRPATPAPRLFPRPRRRRLAAALTSLSCLALVAGCGGGDGSAVENPFLAYLPDFDAPDPVSALVLVSGVTFLPSLADDVADLLDLPKYQNTPVSIAWLQQNFDSAVPNSATQDPLRSSRAVVAHAAGITGRGQVVAMSDSAVSFTHDSLAGRVSVFSTSNLRDEHGTAVASVIAGNSDDFIGTAPGASLLAGDFLLDPALTAMGQIALNNRAVAWNNSWGYTTIGLDQTGFNDAFNYGPDGQAYLAALDAYAAYGVVVFAGSNIKLQNAGLMDGLPWLRNTLEAGWLAVMNGVPTLNGTEVTGVHLVSNACWEAARWCLVADGTWNAATGGGSDYAPTTGTSFAAPQVAGALALLAEAFPDLSPHELRIRLLASAEDDFFTPDATVELADGFIKGYSVTYGHGFLDIEAALRPIGATRFAMADGREVATEDMAFSTGGAMGDAMARGLEGVNLAAKDQLGAGFAVAAKSFATEAAPLPLAETRATRAMHRDLAAARTAPVNPLARSFEAFAGHAMEMTTPDGGASASVMLGGDDSYGVALSRRVAEGVLNLDLGLKLARDDGSLMGFSDATGGGATMAAVTVSLSHDLGNGGFFALTGEMGMADLATPTAMSRVSTARFDSISLDLGGRNVFARDDRLSVGVSMPIAVSSGEAVMDVPVALGAGRSEMRSLALDLAPTERQVDLSISYQMPMGDASEFLLELVHAENYGNRAGVTDQAAVIGMKWKF